MSILVSFLLPVLSFLGVASPVPNSAALESGFQSVEYALAEVSPLGEAGGLAVPASGESASCSLTFDTNPLDQGNNTNANYALSFSADFTSPSTAIYAYRCNSSVANCNSTWNLSYATLGITPTYWVRVAGGGENLLAGGLSGTSGSFSAAAFSLSQGTYLYRLAARYYGTYQGTPGHAGTLSCDGNLTIGASSPPTECTDDIDNDGDGGIDWDGVPGGNQNFSTADAVRTGLNTAAGSTIIPAGSYLFGNQTSAKKACEVMGYSGATINSTATYGGILGVPSGNVTKWTGTAWQTVAANSGAQCVGGNVCTGGTGRGGTCGGWTWDPCASYSYPNNLYVTNLTCTGGGGGTPPDPDCDGPEDPTEDGDGPEVVLEVSDDFGASWTTSNITIDPGDTVWLQWTSSNDPDSCNAIFGSGFNTGGALNGIDKIVNEPTSGNYEDYRVGCSKTGYNPVYDTIRVTATTQISIEANPSIVYQGDDSTISWNTGAVPPANCSVSGPGIDIPVLASSTGSSVETINNESTYLLDCGVDGNDTATVRVLPVIEET